MARRDQSNTRKLELLNELTTRRVEIKVKKRMLDQQVSENIQHIKDSINIPKLIGNKIKSSFRNSPTKWFIGSTIGGLLISKFFFKSKFSLFKKTKPEQSEDQSVTKGILFTLTMMAAKPLIKSFLIGKAKDYVAQRFLGQEPDHQYEDQDEIYYYGE